MISDELYRAALEEASEPVFIIDGSRHIVYANKRAYKETGYDSFEDVTPGDIYPDIAKTDSGYRALFEPGFCHETFAYRANGTCYPVILCSSPIKWEKEEYAALFATDDTRCRELIDSHKKAMEDVEAARKLKNEFTANITHELRTPINGIKGMAEGLYAAGLTLEQQEAVGIILHCCDNMSKIISDLLDFSKLEAGKIEIEKREFSLKKLLNDTLTLHVRKINEKGLKLIVNVSGPIPDRLIGDELRLGQVINNLISNAVKFTSTGHIGLELTANSLPDGMIELFFLIIDTGIGISEEDQDKLFKSFSQVDGTITRRFGGTGLGLAITKQLVTLMGGNISVESEKGKGSTFSFTVRVKDAKGKEKTDFPQGSFEFSNSIASALELPEAASDYGTSGFYGNTGLPDPSALTGEIDYYDASGGRDHSEADDYYLLDELEKLKICIELGAWEKAEEFAGSIKNQIAGTHPDLKRTAFSMLLNVRKEEHDQAYELAESLTRSLIDTGGVGGYGI